MADNLSTSTVKGPFGLAPKESWPRFRTAAFAVLAAAVGVAVALSWRSAVAGLAVVAVLILLAVPVRYALYLLAVALGLNITFLSDPIHLSVPQVLSLSVIGAIILRGMLLRSPNHRTDRLWAWSGILFTVATLPSLVGTVSPAAALAGTAQLVVAGLLVYAAVRFFSTDSVSIGRMCMFLVIGALISTVPAFLQSALELGHPSLMRGGLMRAYSTYGQPNSYGHYLAGVIPLALGLSLKNRGYAFALLMAVAALILTVSRGAIAATGFAIFVVLLLYSLRRSRVVPVVITGAAALLVALAVLVPPAWFSDLTSLRDWSSQQRLLALLTTWEGITQRPLLGWGSGSFRILLPRIRVEGFVDDIEMPHNILLEIWFELGLLALVTFLILIFLYYRSALRTYRRTGDRLLLALMGSFTGLLAASMFGTLIVRGIAAFLALLVGMTAGRIHQLNASTAPSSQRPSVT